MNNYLLIQNKRGKTPHLTFLFIKLYCVLISYNSYFIYVILCFTDITMFLNITDTAILQDHTLDNQSNNLYTFGYIRKDLLTIFHNFKQVMTH